MTLIAQSIRAALSTAGPTHVEGTGGGCEAFVTVLGSGDLLVTTDGNFGVTFDHMGAEVSMACFTRSAWEDGGQDHYAHRAEEIGDQNAAALVFAIMDGSL